MMSFGMLYTVNTYTIFLNSSIYRLLYARNLSIACSFDDDMTILMCAQKLTDASLIYRTEPKTKTRKMKKLKNKNGYAQKKR